MPIVGFGYEKISVERKETTKQVEITNNVNFTSLKETKMKIGNEEKPAVKANFDYSVDYQEAGKLQMIGYVVFYDTEAKVKEYLDLWKKQQKLATEFGAHLYNFIIAKASIRALQLEEDLSLPLHITLPRVVPKK